MRETIKQFKRNLLQNKILDYRIIEYTILRADVLITTTNVRESISELKFKIRSRQILNTDIIQYRILPARHKRNCNETTFRKRRSTPKGVVKGGVDDGYGTRPGYGTKNSRSLSKKK